MDGEEQRKIRFSVPPAAPPQLDPRQVELVAVCENGGVKTRKDNTTPYQPPSLKAVQKMARSHLQSPDVSDSEDISPDSDRDPTDYDISNQSGQNSALEFTDEEEDDSAPLHQTAGAEEDGSAPLHQTSGAEEDGSAPLHQTAGAEEDGSAPLQQTAGAAVQAYMKCPEKGAVPWETSENEEDAPGSAEELPDITTANQSDHHSDHEVIDEQLGSAPLHEALTE